MASNIVHYSAANITLDHAVEGASGHSVGSEDLKLAPPAFCKEVDVIGCCTQPRTASKRREDSFALPLRTLFNGMT